MAILHKATLKPSKDELLNAHVATLPAVADALTFPLARIGAYRFDDPAGEVGVETHLLQGESGPVAQIPLTYRGAPLAGAEECLIDTMEHSVLGKRWIYNACGDPIYVSELVKAILTGGSQVDQFVETDDGPVEVEPTARVVGSGTPGTPVPTIDSVEIQSEGSDTLIRVTGIEVVVRHLLRDQTEVGEPSLLGTWTEVDTPSLLAYIRSGTSPAGGGGG